jgi:hypothetical protein
MIMRAMRWMLASIFRQTHGYTLVINSGNGKFSTGFHWADLFSDFSVGRPSTTGGFISKPGRQILFDLLNLNGSNSRFVRPF